MKCPFHSTPPPTFLTNEKGEGVSVSWPIYTIYSCECNTHGPIIALTWTLNLNFISRKFVISEESHARNCLSRDGCHNRRVNTEFPELLLPYQWAVLRLVLALGLSRSSVHHWPWPYGLRCHRFGACVFTLPLAIFCCEKSAKQACFWYKGRASSFDFFFHYTLMIL